MLGFLFASFIQLKNLSISDSDGLGIFFKGAVSLSSARILCFLLKCNSPTVQGATLIIKTAILMNIFMHDGYSILTLRAVGSQAHCLDVQESVPTDLRTSLALIIQVRIAATCEQASPSLVNKNNTD